jgi:alpha-tubulin suppressor-like RCC1 family protein
VACAGNNHWGQLGDGLLSSRVRAERIEHLPTVSSLAAGHSHACALSSSGRLLCWGNVIWGQLGYGPLLVDVATPVRVYGLPIRALTGRRE